MAEAHFRIGAVARLSGLTTHVIRVWERRYRALSPHRTQAGARLYSEADIARLKLLKRAVAQGHAIGQIAHLDRDVLERLTARPTLPSGSDAATNFATSFVDAVRTLDQALAERVLVEAAMRVSPRELLRDVFCVALRLVGDAWETGKLCVASEHLASILIRDRASAMLRTYSPGPVSETMVVSTPSGELHELGALLAAISAAMHGFRIVYLGPNLPAHEIAGAVKNSGATILALSVVALDAQIAKAEITTLLRVIPDRVALLLGGAQAPVVSAQLGGSVVAPASFDSYEEWLASRRLIRQVEQTLVG